MLILIIIIVFLRCQQVFQYGFKKLVFLENDVNLTAPSNSYQKKHVLIELNTFELIQRNKLSLNCFDLRFKYQMQSYIDFNYLFEEAEEGGSGGRREGTEDGGKDLSGVLGIDYWIESGCGTNSTQVWLEMNLPNCCNLTIEFDYFLTEDALNILLEQPSLDQDRKEMKITNMLLSGFTTQFPSFIVPFLGLCPIDNGYGWKVINSYEDFQYPFNYNENIPYGVYVRPTTMDELETLDYSLQSGNYYMGHSVNIEVDHIYSSPEGPISVHERQLYGEFVYLYNHDHSYSNIPVFNSMPENNNVDNFHIPFMQMDFCIWNAEIAGTRMELDSKMGIFWGNNEYVPDGWEKLDSKYNERFIRMGHFSQNNELNNIDVAIHNHSDTVYLEEAMLMETISIKYDTTEDPYLATSDHYHEYEITYLSEEDETPEFRDVIVLKKTSEEAKFVESMMMLSLFEPYGWEFDHDYDFKYLRYNDAAGQTGGSESHEHYFEVISGSGLFVNGETYLEPLVGEGSLLNGSHYNHTHYVYHQTGEGSYNVKKNTPPAFNYGIIRRKKSIPTYEFMNSTTNDWDCGGVNHNDNKSCMIWGTCVGQDLCICNGSNYGSLCQECITDAFYEKKKIIKIPYKVHIGEITDEEMTENFNCSKMIVNSISVLGGGFEDGCICRWETDSLIETSFLSIEGCSNKDVNSLVVMPLSLKTDYASVTVKPYKPPKAPKSLIDQYWEVFFLGIPGAFFILIFCVGLFLTIMGLIMCAQKKKLKKYKGLKDVDLIIEEQKAECDTSVAHLKINKKLFEIDYDDIRVLRKIGEGGSSSVVYRAEWKGKIVGFKCFKTSMICHSQDKFGEFEKEVNILASVSHPNILSFFGATMHVPRVGIIMEFCDKGDVNVFLTAFTEENNIPYPLKEKLRILLEISSAVDYIHSVNIIHRDLKCENVLITKNEESRLMDFGLSKVVERISQAITKRVGTSVYMAPEVVRGEDYTNKCDVFSFGIMIFEIITQDFQPYGKKSTYNLEFKVAGDPNCRPKFTKSVRKDNFNDLNWLINLTQKCWAHDENDRPTFSDIILKFVEYNDSGGNSSTLNEEYISSEEKEKEEKEKKEKEKEKLIAENKQLTTETMELEQVLDKIKNEYNQMMKKASEKFEQTQNN